LPAYERGWVIACETARDEELPEEFGDFKTYRSRNYGKVKITLYRKDSDF
jgi:16S rRNA G966 N2-methylase RsmD